MNLRKRFTEFINGRLSQEEARTFLEHVHSGEDQALLQELVQEALADPVEQKQLMNSELIELLDDSWTILQKKMQEEPTKTEINWRRIFTIAAIFLCVLTTGLWMYLPSADESVLNTNHEIVAGTNRATLTLADGSTIDLSDQQTGIVIGAEDIKYSDGSSINHVIPTEAEGSVRLPGNTQVSQLALSTPKGGQYQITLPDGTKVWLNAASKLSYPSRFTGKERRVELEGEAYFEVAKNTKQPFIVTSNNQAVVILGTQFNINSYADEKDIRTTLIEGSVQVSAISQTLSSSPTLSSRGTMDPYKPSIELSPSTILTPGQQSTLSESGKLTITEVDTAPYISWINNEFTFDGEDIEVVMRKIARWYNVDIVYQGTKTKAIFGGGVSRFEKVEEVLKQLQRTGAVHFKTEGKTIYVLP